MSKAKKAEVVPVGEQKLAVRTPEVIAAEIRVIDSQARQYVLQSAITIGQLLEEAKATVKHGEWGAWLQENVSYSQSTANNFMKVAAEYGNSQALANLSYSQAVMLLTVPAEEREQFAQETSAAELSTRELKAAIKAREEAEARAKEEQERAKAAEEQAAAAKAAREVVSKALDEARLERKELDTQISGLQEELEKAKAAGDSKAEAKFKAELRKAQKTASEQQGKVTELEQKLADQKAQFEAAANELLQKQKQDFEERSREKEQEWQNQVAKLEQQLKRSNNEPFLRAKLAMDQIVKDGDTLVKAIHAVVEMSEQAILKGAATQVITGLISAIEGGKPDGS